MTVTNAPTMADAVVVELRQYTLRPGRTPDLVRVFERHLVETQEAEGMRVGGVFHDLDRPDRFVWMRGFASMPERREALAAFYSGPAWKQHGPAANETMLDSDDVLLLRPTAPARPPGAPRPRAAPSDDDGRPADDGPVVTVAVWHHEPGRGTCAWLAREVVPVLEDALGTAVAAWRTEPAENTFPALPVRGDHVFVWTTTFADDDAHRAASARLEASPAWSRCRDRVEAVVTRREELRLRPTRRSEHPPATEVAP